MTLYFENIKDIIDYWGDYPVDTRCPAPAYNSGVVSLKCFINNVCPFYKTPKKEDGLIFNDLTFEQIKRKLDSETFNDLETAPGLDGIYFRSRYVFRHNYIYKLREGISDTDRYNSENRYDNFDDYYEDISTSKVNPSNPVVGSGRTRYKKDQSWIVVPSVFDENICDLSTSSAECNIKASWAYTSQSESASENGPVDLVYDYEYDYYLEYVNSLDPITEMPREGEKDMIYLTQVQMPVQQTIHNNKNQGIHWRLMKRTPLFKGEDFFIRFRKQAQESNVFSENEKNIYKKFSSLYEQYSPLDIMAVDKDDDKVVIDSSIPDFKKFANDAVRFSDDDDSKPKKSGVYDFFTQAYYIIEMYGLDSTEERYFIVIPERGYPTFIHFFAGRFSDGVVSKRLGEPFKGISGEKLIKSTWFDIVVRNHLGRLAIQFRGDFTDPPLWVVERRDWVAEEVDAGETTFMTEEFSALIVPRGRISIWGGNIKTGFIFSPLQYSASKISFAYPPRHSSKEGEEKKIEAWTGEKKEAALSTKYFESDPLWLPLNKGEGDDMDGEHLISFNSGPSKVETGMVGDKEAIYQHFPLFTGDAQFYRDYNDKKEEKYNLGYFYYDEPIRAFPETVYPGVKASKLVVRKNRYHNDNKTRHQGFDVFIGMSCGDHVFSDGESSPLGDIDDYPDFTEYVDSSKNQDMWYLRNCKTPILASLRIESPPSDSPRWDDGTTIRDGIEALPSGKSRYFIDASEHVMSFSHAWSASGFSQMEHSGSIQFYLNREFLAQNERVLAASNVTDYLLSLQDKTFYIEVWGGYESCNYSRIPGLYKMFTGVCEGGTISYEYGKIVMNCELQDYSVVLKGMQFFNSPWFDGLKDVVAINEILKFAGFRDRGHYDPGIIIGNLSDGAVNLDNNLNHPNYDGRMFKFEPYVLPSGYSRLEQPAFKFNDGDFFIDAINKIGKLSGKMFYFDEFGIAHYEDYQDLVQEDYLGEIALTPLYHFTTNPAAVGGQLVFNKVDRSFDVSGIYNHIKVLTNTPDMHLLIRDNLNWQSFENPEITGFLGYQRTSYQQESMFGSKESQLATIKKYSVGFKPKIRINFETYGVPLRATDVVSIGGEELGEPDIVRVTKVNHTFDPAKNQWWMQVECERYQPISAATVA